MDGAKGSTPRISPSCPGRALRADVMVATIQRMNDPTQRIDRTLANDEQQA
jgi:hypothetical protein